MKNINNMGSEDKRAVIMSIPLISEYEMGYRKGMSDAALIALRTQVSNNEVKYNCYNHGCFESYESIVNSMVSFFD